MKIKIELDTNIQEEEIVIKCSEINGKIQKIQKLIFDTFDEKQTILFYKDDLEYYLKLNDILFFETNGNIIDAHTFDTVYTVRHRLYELEEILPSNFIRISKSTILNSKQIYSIDRNITSSSVVQFYKTHKQVYVSRYYYRYLREKLNERRN